MARNRLIIAVRFCLKGKQEKITVFMANNIPTPRKNAFHKDYGVFQKIKLVVYVVVKKSESTFSPGGMETTAKTAK